jgi:hypothetical protein
MRSIFTRFFIVFILFAFAGATTSCNRAACYTKPSVAKKKHKQYNSYQYK